MMDLVIPVVRCVDPAPPYPSPWASLTDLHDIPIWGAAVMAGADFVVSENRRHFPPATSGRHLYAGVEYLTVADFLDCLAP